ncbi:MAG: TonB-dependent receptor [Bacteroidales bacterium]|nr:TonB-dependent receptor [Bacteroidales bacterium]
MHFNKSIIISAVLLLFASFLFAQNETQQLKLVLRNNDIALSFAHYNYGKQKGVADENGIIFIQFSEGTKLEISHLSSGYQSFESDQVKQGLGLKKLVVKGDGSFNLQPVTVIALRHAITEKQTMQVGTKELLAHDAGTFLQMNPAVSGIRKSGSSSVDPVMRGFKYEQLTIVTDGACGATAACPNRMDPPSSQVSLNMMERIEILKGPHALRYGNSFGGTIHFISPETKYADKLTPLARISAGYESNGGIMRTEAMAGLSSKKVNWQLFGALSQGSDYKDGNGSKVAADFYRNSIGTSITSKISENQEMKITAQHNFAKDVDFPSLPMDLRSDDAWLFNARHSISFKENTTRSIITTAYATFVDHFMDNGLKELVPRTVNAETPAKTSNIGGRSEIFIVKGAAKIFAGVDGRFEEAEGSRKRTFLLGPMAGKTFIDNAWQHGQITKASVFGEYQHVISDWAFIVAARMELNQATVKDPTQEFLSVYGETSPSQINPSLSAGVSHYWNSRFSTSFWIGHTQRSGSLTERYINYFPVGLDAFEMLGNPEIKPESNNQIDLNLQYRHEKTSLRLSFFGALLQDFISARKDSSLKPRITSSPGVRQFVNLGNAMMTGFELSFGQALAANLLAELNMAFVYGKDLDANAPLPEIPPLDLRFSISGCYFDGRFNPVLSLRYVSDQNRISEEFAEKKTPSFILMDLAADYRFNKSLKIRAGVQNLFDEAYYEHLSRAVNGVTDQPLYAPGRNIYLSLNYRL